MIYIVSPSNSCSGGTESLHQLASFFIQAGIETCMFYTKQPLIMQKQDSNTECINPYGIPVAKEINDSEDNMLIVPETETQILQQFNCVLKVIWWLSLTYYQVSTVSGQVSLSMKYHRLPRCFFPFVFVGKALTGKLSLNRGVYDFGQHDEVFHLYNCEFVHRFLEKKGIPGDAMQYLCGPISQTIFEAAEKLKRPSGFRENIILYNPKKDTGFVTLIENELMKRRPDCKVVPIKNMKPEEVAKIMSEAKIYIDFGYFPGPERLPREAVLLGCNIMTSTDGAASNGFDVPIPNSLKFKASRKNISVICDTLSLMLDDYGGFYSLNDAYREKVKEQRERFPSDAVLLLKQTGYIPLF